MVRKISSIDVTTPRGPNIRRGRLNEARRCLEAELQQTDADTSHWSVKFLLLNWLLMEGILTQIF